jgi:hypothetical protein
MSLFVMPAAPLANRRATSAALSLCGIEQRRPMIGVRDRSHRFRPLAQ